MGTFFLLGPNQKFIKSILQLLYNMMDPDKNDSIVQCVALSLPSLWYMPMAVKVQCSSSEEIFWPFSLFE